MGQSQVPRTKQHHLESTKFLALFTTFDFVIVFLFFALNAPPKTQTKNNPLSPLNHVHLTSLRNCTVVVVVVVGQLGHITSYIFSGTVFVFGPFQCRLECTEYSILKNGKE